MKLELFNTTDRVKTLPKFRYAGKMTLGPKEAVRIEDYMTEFFAPYARTGVVIRSVVETVSPETEVKAEEPEIKKESEDEVVGNKEIIEVKDEVKEENSEGVEPENESEVVEEKKDEYTRESLSELSARELRDLATTLGVDTSDIRRKDLIVDAILNR